MLEFEKILENLNFCLRYIAFSFFLSFYLFLISLFCFLEKLKALAMQTKEQCK
uniref:Uncharacterized protein n=1 Tax=Siphoviridae sp. ctvyM23 TaxID=2826514 RepID=A0A8S5MIG8_9CAUD|nr:MAG TPA: hypothetical protein [Siphoviridae sp. ctvyM23]